MSQGLDVQIQDHPGIAVRVPAIGEGVNYNVFHRLGRRVFWQVQGVVSRGSWLILDVSVPVVWTIFTQLIKSWFKYL